VIERPATILVVDDIEDNRDLLTRRLVKDGHDIREAVNGVEALRVLRSVDVDLVLLDINMPEMSGTEVLDTMKSDPELRHIPVIMITAIDDMDTTVHCIKNGAEDYLTKPFNGRLLKSRVGSCLERKRLRDQEVVYLRRIEEEKKRADNLLHVLLPEPVVEELKESGHVQPRRHEEVAVLFADIVGFTSYCESHQPEEVVDHLQEMVTAFEEISVRHGLMKIKTVGDAFMATANLLAPCENPVLSCAQGAWEMLERADSLSSRWQTRIGIHYGPVVAGIVGGAHYSFDIWGDTVNTAARVEGSGVPGAINLSQAAWERILHCCQAESLGLIELKGKGRTEVFKLVCLSKEC
jgi:class 3 adenylate cyclase/CheY-like chemotaxis protein